MRSPKSLHNLQHDEEGNYMEEGEEEEDKHWQNSCTVLAVRRKNSDSQATERDNLFKTIPENQMVGALSPFCLVKLS